MAGQSGSPVVLSQNTAVSRWLAIPIAAMRDAGMRAVSIASLAAVSWLSQISRGSCSTQPGRG